MDSHNHYIYFTKICNNYKLKYFKYKASLLWEGPALILENNSNIINIKKKFKIPLNQDIINDDIIALYPQKSEKVESIKYDYVYEMEDCEIDTVVWEYMNYRFLLNEKNNNIYDITTKDFLGRRVLISEDEYTIDCDVDEEK
jgi:hypothetical protein